MTRVLVTGASGLLGLNFALQVSEQHEVYGVVNHQPWMRAVYRVLQADLAHRARWSGCWNQLPEVVLHCAAMARDACENTARTALPPERRTPANAAASARAACAWCRRLYERRVRWDERGYS